MSVNPLDQRNLRELTKGGQPATAVGALKSEGATPTTPGPVAGKPGFDLVGSIMAHEDGTLNLEDTLVLFSHLVRTGAAWSLQGSYGRFATTLIDHGYLTQDGDIIERED